MISALRTYLIRRRFKRMMASFEARIAEARKKHQPVRHIVREQRQFLHDCLRVGVGVCTPERRESRSVPAAWRGAR